MRHAHIHQVELADAAHLQERHLFFFTDTATTEIYTLSLHDALPILYLSPERKAQAVALHSSIAEDDRAAARMLDRKSTRLNSSHVKISYAVFCLKKTTSAAWCTRTRQRDKEFMAAEKRSHAPHRVPE